MIFSGARTASPNDARLCHAAFPVTLNSWYTAAIYRGMVNIFPNNRRALLAFLHDVAMAAVSMVASLYLRIGNGILDYEPQLTAIYIVSFTLIAASVFLLTGLYRGIWRYASLPDLFNIARAVSFAVLAFLPVMFVLTRLEALPRSALLIDWFVLIALLGGPRLAYRLFKDRGLDHILERVKHQSVPVLLISAKDGADTFIREMRRDPRAVYRVVGVLADTPSRVGREIYRVPILGTIDTLETVVEQLDRRGKRPQKLLITAQNLPGEQVRRLLDQADALAIPLARLPRLTDFQRNLDNPDRALEPIALEDLLGRPQVVLDRDAMARLIRGRRVLITGAGGPSARNSPGRLPSCRPADWSCSITANSLFTPSRWSSTNDSRRCVRFPCCAMSVIGHKSMRSLPPKSPKSFFMQRR